MARQSIRSGGTKQRLLEAAELLFIEYGFDAMSLRQITMEAGANLAAVNYHFGTKEALVHELLSSRLDRLNEERLQLLSDCEQRSEGRPLDVSLVLSVLFVPGLRLTRNNVGGPTFMRLLGRVYSDPSPFIRDYLVDHYKPIYGRFFEAFARALPQVPRHELGMRLQFSLKALSGMLASENIDELVSAICIGEEISDTLMLARLIAFISPVLTTPFGQTQEITSVKHVMDLADAAAAVVDARTQTRAGSRHGSRKPNSGLTS
jgi:AcrR family transcriptional regulator